MQVRSRLLDYSGIFRVAGRWPVLQAPLGNKKIGESLQALTLLGQYSHLPGNCKI